MDIYYDQINQLVQDLLIPARMEKTINKETFENFYEILVKIENGVQGKENISRKIVGLLFFIYCSLSDEVVTNDYKDELFRAVGKLEDILDRIFWDSPFKE